MSLYRLLVILTGLVLSSCKYDPQKATLVVFGQNRACCSDIESRYAGFVAICDVGTVYVSSGLVLDTGKPCKSEDE